MILSYIESILPFSVGIPGVKLGLPNLIVVLLLYQFGAGEALIVNLVRILLTGFLFGNLSAVVYALAGGLSSFCVMALFCRMRCFSIMGVSIAGGVFHNIGQIAVASFVVETFAPVFYLPFLLIAGVITGLIIGIAAARTAPYLRKHMRFD